MRTATRIRKTSTKIRQMSKDSSRSAIADKITIIIAKHHITPQANAKQSKEDAGLVNINVLVVYASKYQS